MTEESIYKSYKPAVVDDAGEHNGAYWFIFHGKKMLVQAEGDQVKIPFAKSPEELQISPRRKQYLGTLYDCPCYSVEAEAECDSDAESSSQGCFKFEDLYSLYPFLSRDIFFLAGKASQIVKWDQEHQFCGRCGTPTEPMPGERAKICPKCGFFSFPRISPAVITAVFRDGKILLARNKNFRGNIYSLIAGFVEPGETLEECVSREVKEEVGIEVKNIRYFASQPWPFPNSLMMGFTADYAGGEIQADGTEIDDAGWFSPDNMPPIPSKISIARKIIDWYLEQSGRKL